jgi:hypothetical protein
VALVEVSLLRRVTKDRCVVYTGDGYRQQACAKADDVWVDAVLAGASWKLALCSKAGQNQLTIKVS